jgi:O-succinylbenzoate synthase
MAEDFNLHLGPRQVVVGGKLIGSIDDVTLLVAEAHAEELKELLEAHTIELRRIIKG